MFKSKIIGKSYFRRKNCQMSHFWKKLGKKWGKTRSKLEKIGKSQIEARFSARFEARSSSKNQVKASYLALFSISKLEARFFSSQIVQLGQKLARFPTLIQTELNMWISMFSQRKPGKKYEVSVTPMAAAVTLYLFQTVWNITMLL